LEEQYVKLTLLILQDSNDFPNIQLTPEQQRQLEEIEKMPLTTQRPPSESGLLLDSNDPDVGKSR
jgi:hypothetical protein